jgi:glutaryl-CoA transferase
VVPDIAEGSGREQSARTLLDGLRVIERADGLAGAIAGKFFADFGADVLMVEPPRVGSEVRWQPPFLDDLAGSERGGLFLYAGAGKRSLTLDVASADGRAIMERLLARSDLLIDDGASDGGAACNVSTGRHGNHPNLVHLNLRQFSTGGPYAEYLGTELQAAAMGGWMAQVGEPGRPPLMANSRTMVAFVPGIQGASAAMAALMRARGGGGGVCIEVSAHEALLFNTRFNETYYAYLKTEIKRTGNAMAGWTPTYRVFEAADGFVACGASTDQQVEALLDLAGITDERFATRAARNEHAGELLAALAKWFASQRRDDTFHEAQARRIPMAKVATVDELPNLEHLKQRRFFVERDHPVAGRRLYPGVPVRLDGQPVVSRRRAPLLGEHTAQVLCGELGFTVEEVATLSALGVT